MSNSTKLWSVLISFVIFSTGCKKEIIEEPEFNAQFLRSSKSGVEAPTSKQFKMSAKTWYRVTPTALADVPGLQGQLAFANIPGAGSGTATNMGNVGMWFNQRAFSPNGQNPQAGTVAAPLAEACTYSETAKGGPLPALQPDDLRTLHTLNNWLQIPATVSGKLVWFVVYNQGGDAIFLSRSTPSFDVNESATRTSFTAEGTFVGGRGKFENASGTYQLTGFYNPEDPNDGGIIIDGEISY